jgi:hypothetical protein
MQSCRPAGNPNEVEWARRGQRPAAHVQCDARVPDLADLRDHGHDAPASGLAVHADGRPRHQRRRRAQRPRVRLRSGDHQRRRVAAGMRGCSTTRPDACELPRVAARPIADRNSCRNGWSQSLDLRASVRPNLPTVERRLTISDRSRNVLTGLDRCSTGATTCAAGARASARTRTLLNVRGFDHATRAFHLRGQRGLRPEPRLRPRPAGRQFRSSAAAAHGDGWPRWRYGDHAVVAAAWAAAAAC